MQFYEPTATAFLLTALGILMGGSALFSRAAGRFGVPVALLFIVLGVLGGSEGIGGIAFENYGFAFRLGTVALVLILFDGGLNTPSAACAQAPRPGGVARHGRCGRARRGVVAVAARVLGFDWRQALLLGAIVSSTDAAAVFSVLRGSGMQLKRRVGATLELESGLNDPMAVILTIALTGALLTPATSLGWHPRCWRSLWEIGGRRGARARRSATAGALLLERVRLPAGGLYPVLTLALAFLAFGAADAASTAAASSPCTWRR